MFGPSAKCPYCHKVISTVNVETIGIETGLSVGYKGVTYSCPGCHAVLSVEMDPIALKADIVRDLLKALRKG